MDKKDTISERKESLIRRSPSFDYRGPYGHQILEIQMKARRWVGILGLVKWTLCLIVSRFRKT